MENPDPDPYASLLAFILNDFFVGFNSITVISVIILILLLVLSAIISGSEVAFFSLQPDEIHELEESYSKSERLTAKLREQPRLLLSTIYIANNFVNITTLSLSIIFTHLIFNTETNPVAAILIQLITIVLLITIFGELIPKQIASKNPKRFSSMVVSVIYFLTIILKPFSKLLSTKSFIKNQVSRKIHNLSINDLSTAIDISSDKDTPPEEKKMLKGIVSFNEKEARNIMKSRVDITAVDIKTEYSDLIELVVNCGFSRIPVYDGSFDNVVGILYIKDLLPHIKAQKVEWQKLIRPAFFIPENKKINDLLQEFRKKKIHLAIVVDEYGGTSGLITLEDIIEEIVGEIKDEYDDDLEEKLFTKIDDSSYLFEARINLFDFCQVMNLNNHYFEDVQGESDTLSGLLLEMEGKIPEVGDKIKFKQFVFEIIDADPRRIKQIKVTSTENINEE